MSEGLPWPPRKEDLERMYLAEMLSAAKIAKVYGLDKKYKTPKVAESTILYQLKKNAITRRDRAEHVRKVTTEMVDAWEQRYVAGESLKQIAGLDIDPVTVWGHLRSRNIALRDKVEAQVNAVTKYERHPFSGDRLEKAYLMGLRYGDLDAVIHGRSVRVRVSTTHRAMASLFEASFSRYGMVHRYPRESKLTHYEWTLECDLDDSFSFLLQKADLGMTETLPLDELIQFLSGLFDAEGSAYLHNKRGRYNPELFFSNTDPALVHFISHSLTRLGLKEKTSWRIQDADRRGVSGYSRIARVGLWRFEEVKIALRILEPRHDEKVRKAALTLQMEPRGNDERYEMLIMKWNSMIAEIKKERDEFVESARVALAKRRAFQTQKVD